MLSLQAALEFAQNGLTGAPWWALIIIFVVATQCTVWSVTLYLHRCMAHRGVDMHPLITHPMRLWLWLSTGMVTKEWVAIHRKHHARCETEEDPHSPQTHGIAKVLFHGVTLYTKEAENTETLEKYGHGCPDDWLERTFYSKFWVGPALLLILDFALFGAIGITFWALQIIWIPLFAAGVINGAGHYWGYRNFTTEDTSTNLVPWGLFLGGEELHNNHHAFPSSARFALKKWEFDIGWMWLRAMQTFKLARVRRVAPSLVREPTLEAKEQVTVETLKAVFALRFEVMSDYCRNVIKPLVNEEAERARDQIGRMRRQARKLLSSDARFFCEKKRARLKTVLSESNVLATAYDYRMRLQALWDRSSTDPETLLNSLKQWCREAEASGIESLREFSRALAGYRLASQAT